MSSEYTQLLKSLFEISQKNVMKLGLETMHFMNSVLGFPSQNFLSIHVAGTNGKGSTTTKIAKALELSNPELKIGLFTSPHISTFRERIKINDIIIPEKKVLQTLQRILTLAESHSIKPTFFELTTLLAFCYFREENVDIAVIETGIGGRLDATNIIDPILSVITSIDYDHQAILGASLDEIGFEKAGIIKMNCPVVVGPKAHRVKIIHETAQRKNAPYFFVREDFDDYELENQSIARKALMTLSEYSSLSITEKSVEEGIKVRPSCRFEKRIFEDKTVILDVAHNPDGIKALFQKVKKSYPNFNIRVLVGMSKDKDIASSFSIIESYANTIYLTEALTPRAASVDHLEELINLDKISSVYKFTSVKECMRVALKQTDSQKDLLVVCGSFFIMQAVRQVLLIDEEVDFCLFQEI